MGPWSWEFMESKAGLAKLYFRTYGQGWSTLILYLRPDGQGYTALILDHLHLYLAMVESCPNNTTKEHSNFFFRGSKKALIVVHSACIYTLHKFRITLVKETPSEFSLYCCLVIGESDQFSNWRAPAVPTPLLYVGSTTWADWHIAYINHFLVSVHCMHWKSYGYHREGLKPWLHMC